MVLCHNIEPKITVQATMKNFSSSLTHQKVSKSAAGVSLGRELNPWTKTQLYPRSVTVRLRRRKCRPGMPTLRCLCRTTFVVQPCRQPLPFCTLKVEDTHDHKDLRHRPADDCSSPVVRTLDIS